MNPYVKEILLIDVNLTNLSFTLNYLGKQGYRVDGATGYLDALQKIKKSQYDLAIVFDGLEEREIDYIEDLAAEIRPGLRLIRFSDPVQKLPARINRALQENG